MGDTDYLSLLEGPTSSSYGTGLYDFGYQPTTLPPSEVATTASQLESGSTGVNWDVGSGVGNLITDITKAWTTVQDHKNATSIPTGYARAADGSIYAVDPAYRGTAAPTVGGALNHIPISFLLIGALVFFVITAEAH